MSTISKTIKSGILGSLVVAAMSTSAFAGGDLSAPAAKNACSLSANVALTTDYVWRGVSQTQEDAAIQGGMDVSCGIVYAGIWGSNVDFDDDTTIEVDFYAGIKKEYRGVTFDVGAIYYAFDDADNTTDIKVGVSGEIASVSVGATAFFNIDAESNAYEFSAEKSFSKISGITPTLSAMVGFTDGDDVANYTYWNAGVSLGFTDTFALDLRYHDTDLDNDPLADERFVATLSASF